MKGTILWNIWALIAGFTLYFLLSFAQGEPWPVILQSFAAGGAFFLLTYIVRILLAQAFPENIAGFVNGDQPDSDVLNERADLVSGDLSEQNIEVKTASDANPAVASEDTAKIIRQMLNE
ncbi:hypothetical protein JOC78_000027 [Bacillus ectoiniformans]|uniref:hypothetical protein n=1 Tax=Bacillus ectoiniformans TaxID=1494429 RepID=UPI001956FC0A|nr:hypothetical protein [Bacillus ectoiniformans]MBM7647106.1 hypothetical protein [Bacillus ectoiniformans]